MSPKLKSLLQSDRLFLALLLCLVGVVSFFLGQVSVREGDELSNQAGVVFIDAPALVNDPAAVPVVASNSGTKYHRYDCPGAKTINHENRIYFDSTQLAKAAGYQPAGSCDW